MDAGGSFIMAVRDAVMPGRIGCKAGMRGVSSRIAGRTRQRLWAVGQSGNRDCEGRAAAAMTARTMRLKLSIVCLFCSGEGGQHAGLGSIVEPSVKRPEPASELRDADEWGYGSRPDNVTGPQGDGGAGGGHPLHWSRQVAVHALLPAPGNQLVDANLRGCGKGA